MLTSRAFSIARRSRYLLSGLPPPSRAARTISRAVLVNCCPFLASVRAFLCLIDDHLECPDIFSPAGSLAHLQTRDSMQPALQDHAVGGRDLVICRVDRPAVDRDAFLTGEAPRFAFTAYQSL